MMSLRQRNRHAAMQLTQRTALELFIAQGFDAVTVGEIAEEVGMAASTLYRHFATKESIVLWDEHEAAIDTALARELARQAPLAAIRDVFVDEIGSRYDDDIEFQLRRVRYIYQTSQLHAAGIEADLADTAALTTALEHFLSRPQKKAAPLLAGAAMLALDTAFDRWQAGSGKTALGELISQAFATIGSLDAIS